MPLGGIDRNRRSYLFLGNLLGAVRKALKFALICSVASVLGGIAGYCIGAFAWDVTDKFFYQYVPGFSQGGYDRVEEWYAKWGWAIVLLAGFSPIPYKIFTISAGLIGMSLVPFLLASLVGRGARFFLVAGLILLGGEAFETRLRRHVDVVGWVTIVLLVSGLLWING